MALVVLEKVSQQCRLTRGSDNNNASVLLNVVVCGQSVCMRNSGRDRDRCCVLQVRYVVVVVFKLLMKRASKFCFNTA